MKETKIEWCDVTLNPVVGCTYGCNYCYAKRIYNRFNLGKDFAIPQFFPERLKQLDNPKPERVFLTSMSDPADWEPSWANLIIKAMNKNSQHQYLLLTKRPEQYSKLWFSQGGTCWNPENIWFGTSVTMQREIKRITSLPLKRRFVSIEPILGPIDLIELPLHAAAKLADWIILGAETGNRPGKVKPERDWISNIVTFCDSAGIPVFMKDSLIEIVGEENMRREWPVGLRKAAG